MAKNRILIVDDEADVRFLLKEFLETRGYEIDEANNCQKAQEIFRAMRPDVAIVDYMLPDGNALELLPRLKEIDPLAPIIILTGHGSIDLAVQAVKEGAEQFLTKPLQLPALHILLQRTLENQRNRQKQLAGRSRQTREIIDPFQGTSAAIQRLAELARKVVASDRSILIQGETGTGKGVLANWLHNNGSRGEETFVDLNCAGLTRELLESELFGHEKGAFTGAVNAKLGLLEVAHRGTLFLDEIGDMDLQVQTKLLKVLEEKQFRRLGDVRERRVDIRLIAATHQNIAVLVNEKRFRQDLYFRISTIPLVVPPLRERREDIPVLADYFIHRLAADIGRSPARLAPDAIKALQNYAWPGNIRELRNVLERTVLISDQNIISAQDLYFDALAHGSLWAEHLDITILELEKRFQDIERKLIERTLAREQENVEQAAKRLGISRSTLYEKLKKYRIKF